ncbi:hypothetical protein BB559_001007 [Furculomyces boomerangus]|uniref:Uncharacterized protein n=1 Tax=Furculomyces boomerangus TaxID=61424 RepID=A0A2T9Z3E3_9FUNG|nr:hypothetical protein BB559_004492 [Furculomyces boomerangus]PVU98744.1 hypothetical protein BB559_001317 [Furculomyces boomerangus]PVU99102.1 hypothetical protein BB559_001007 [Furculomyces boomerangus]
MPNIFTDKESRNKIILGTLTCSAIGGSLGASYAILKYVRPIRKPAFAMAGSWGAIGLLFFVARQSLLFEQREKNVAYQIKPSQTKDSDELFSSTTAGGKKGIVFGMAMLGVVSYGTQKIYTSFYRYRQRFILKKLEINENTTSENNINTDGSSESEDNSNMYVDVEYEPTSVGGKMRRFAEKGVLDKFPKWFPLKTLTHHEYVQILDVRKQEIIERLVEIDDELQNLEKAENDKTGENLEQQNQNGN